MGGVGAGSSRRWGGVQPGLGGGSCQGSGGGAVSAGEPASRDTCWWPTRHHYLSKPGGGGGLGGVAYKDRARPPPPVARGSLRRPTCTTLLPRSAVLETEKLPASRPLGPPQRTSRRVSAARHRPTGVGWPSTAVGYAPTSGGWVSTAVGDPNPATNSLRPSFARKTQKYLVLGGPPCPTLTRPDEPNTQSVCGLCTSQMLCSVQETMEGRPPERPPSQTVRDVLNWGGGWGGSEGPTHRGRLPCSDVLMLKQGFQTHGSGGERTPIHAGLSDPPPSRIRGKKSGRMPEKTKQGMNKHHSHNAQHRGSTTHQTQNIFPPGQNVSFNRGPKSRGPLEEHTLWFRLMPGMAGGLGWHRHLLYPDHSSTVSAADAWSALFSPDSG